jgi:hypothetical protein
MDRDDYLNWGCATLTLTLLCVAFAASKVASQDYWWAALDAAFGLFWGLSTLDFIRKHRRKTALDEALVEALETGDHSKLHEYFESEDLAITKAPRP